MTKEVIAYQQWIDDGGVWLPLGWYESESNYPVLYYDNIEVLDIDKYGYPTKAKLIYNVE